MFLIMSSAYVEQELKSEFGQIPPSFLPLGNRRLFQHQVKLAPKDSKVYISVPEKYQISSTDMKWFESNNVYIIRVPEELSLGAALITVLNLIYDEVDKPLHVLFGDTLITSLPDGEDIVAISEVTDSYNWSVVTDDNMNWFNNSSSKLSINKNNVVSGYFRFSQPRQLVKCITQSRWDFLESLNRYHADCGLTSIKIDDWLDFGHVKTYYRSKVSFTTQRAFNELVITPNLIEKSSSNNRKVEAEANWFESLPPIMRGFTPQYLGAEKTNSKFTYRLEYLHQTALNELFVFGELPAIIWRRILTSCLDFLEACTEFEAPKDAICNDLDDLFGVKTLQRLSHYCLSERIDLDKNWNFNNQFSASLSDVLAKSNMYLPREKVKKTILHGDFCFSNILYDFRTSRVKVIDPRGITQNGELSIYGDIRYDIAKLSHSVLGLYDCIIAGYYSLNVDNYMLNFEVHNIPNYQETQELFFELIRKSYGLSALNLYAMQIQLFLSMLPLHGDDPQRQVALMANAFRIYHLMKRLEK
ncbi:TPA: capsular biosynthesis protein [Vibrio vulnificus]